MFQHCYSLKEVGMVITTDTLEDISEMFLMCTELEYVSLSIKHSGASLRNMTGVFSNCPKLEKVYFKLKENRQLSEADPEGKDMRNMFQDNTNLKQVNWFDWDWSKVIKDARKRCQFRGCPEGLADVSTGEWRYEEPNLEESVTPQ